MKKPATMLEKRWMALVSQQPCVICGDWPVEVHHITAGGRRLGNFFTLSLCTFHHRGEGGFSGKNRGAWDKSLENQLALLDKLCANLGVPAPQYHSKIISRNPL